MEDQRKLRGGYYTPSIIADFVCEWAIDQDASSILEPSCGDGTFVVSAIERLKNLGFPIDEIEGKIRAVELVKDEAEKAYERAAMLGSNGGTVINADFFSFVETLGESEKFDVVVGNPPFIRYQNFPEAHRMKATRMMEALGLHPNRLTNIWVPFLVVSSSLLTDAGKLGMVIPAELFQVKYAAEIRIFLAKYFERITIITFKKLVFEGIQQEVVLLLCEKKVTGNGGIRVLELDNLNSLATCELGTFKQGKTKSLDHTTEKWTKYFLDQDEIDLLRKVRGDERIQTASKYLEVDVGFVTGRNDFFMLDQTEVAFWGLEDHVMRVVGRTPQLKGLRFTKQDFDGSARGDGKMYLFLPPDVDYRDLPDACKRYVDYGEQNGAALGYKCRIRKRWYITPSLWVPHGFALRQVNEFPKLVINQAGVSSTDTIHRVRFLDGVNPELASVSFLNSLTFAFSEIFGRSYGGGVLTFEPSEIEELPLPMLSAGQVDASKVDQLLRKKRITNILEINDTELLMNALGFERSEVMMLRGIWEKLRNRRINRK